MTCGDRITCWKWRKAKYCSVRKDPFLSHALSSGLGCSITTSYHCEQVLWLFRVCLWVQYFGSALKRPSLGASDMQRVFEHSEKHGTILAYNWKQFKQHLTWQWQTGHILPFICLFGWSHGEKAEQQAPGVKCAHLLTVLGIWGVDGS